MYQQKYSEGLAKTKLKKIKASKDTGTEITFTASDKIFTSINFVFDTLFLLNHLYRFLKLTKCLIFVTAAVSYTTFEN
jgi:DNA gyrase/topoisomerase IV subunit B